MEIFLAKNITYNCKVEKCGQIAYIDLSEISGLIHSISFKNCSAGDFKNCSAGDFKNCSVEDCSTGKTTQEISVKNWSIIRDRRVVFSRISDYTFFASNLDSNLAKRYYHPIHTKMSPIQVKNSVYWDKVKEIEKNLEIEIRNFTFDFEFIQIECLQFVLCKKDIHFFEVYKEVK